MVVSASTVERWETALLDFVAQWHQSFRAANDAALRCDERSDADEQLQVVSDVLLSYGDQIVPWLESRLRASEGDELSAVAWLLCHARTELEPHFWIDRLRELQGETVVSLVETLVSTDWCFDPIPWLVVFEYQHDIHAAAAAVVLAARGHAVMSVNDLESWQDETDPIVRRLLWHAISIAHIAPPVTS